MSISTHTSLVGCDESLFKPIICFLYFYSHIPCGMWHFLSDTIIADAWFLLTHPLWDVTYFLDILCIFLVISTHTSLVGCDSHIVGRANLTYNFYSHIPCGMWQRGSGRNMPTQNFYSHIPCGMWLLCIFWHFIVCCNFYSHIPCGMWRAID